MLFEFISFVDYACAMINNVYPNYTLISKPESFCGFALTYLPVMVVCNIETVMRGANLFANIILYCCHFLV